MSSIPECDVICSHAACWRKADFTCDYPCPSIAMPCGRTLCAIHAHPRGGNVDYCAKHLADIERNTNVRSIHRG